MTFGTDVLANLAANLAAELVIRSAGRLRDLAFGDAETRALRRAWEQAFREMLEAVAADLAPGARDVLEDVMRGFVAAEGVGDALLELALEGSEPPLALLRARFDALEYDRATLPVVLDAALASLTHGLAAALLAEGQKPGSPLYNRVSMVRAAAIHQMLRGQAQDLASIARAVVRLEAELPRAARYQAVFLGPVSGVALGDGASVHEDGGEGRLLDEVRDLLARIAAAEQPPPYTPADRQAYLDAVVQACEYIHLPTGSDRATIPLERVYVALKADRSSPAERQASQALFQALVDEHQAAHGGDYWRTVRQVARLNPYAARFLAHDPRFAEVLAGSPDRDRTHYLAEIVRGQRWIVLLGDPGSGKTTLARWLALQLARCLQGGSLPEGVQVPAIHVRPDADPDQVEDLGPARLPVLIRIAEYAAARWPRPGEDTRLPLLNYLGRHLEDELQPGRRAYALHALLRDHLEAGRVVFVLDGLDEVTDTTYRRDIAAEIETLIQRHARDGRGLTPLDAGYLPELNGPGLQRGNQVIVTSRIVGYQVHPLPAALPHFVIQPMDDVAVGRFCAAWAAAMGLEAWTGALQKAVLEHPNPRVRDEMARNPLLITVLTQVFAASPGEGLPARRAELYRRASRAMFDQRRQGWKRLAERMGGDDFARAMSRLTAHVAFHLHANPDYPASLAEEESVRAWLREAVAGEEALVRGRRPEDVADDVLAAARELSGFFIARGEGVYGFVHRQFQEYFAAQALVVRPDAEATFLEHLADPAWREVLLLAVGLAGRQAGRRLAEAALNAPDPTRGLLPHNLLLAAAALRELERPPADPVRRVAAGLIRAYRRDDEGRFAVLQRRIEGALAALPRRAGSRDPVGEALCAALAAACPGEGDAADGPDRFTRLAAVELLVEQERYTPDTARALADAWRSHLEPAGSLLVALQRASEAHPEHFAGRFLPFRRAVEAEPALWRAVQAHEHWAAIVRALYLAPGAGLAPEAIVRDSPLTPGVLEGLRACPEDGAGLRRWLRGRFEGAGDVVSRRDAGLALTYLGDGTIVPALAGGGDDLLARAILSAAALDLGMCQ